MFGIKKRKALIWSVTISLLFSCVQQESEAIDSDFIEIQGEAQGTTYSIIIAEHDAELTKSEVDSVLKAFDQVLSTYVESSTISQLNNASQTFSTIETSGWFKRCYEISQQVYLKSEQAFDPSIMPLVDAWGFYRESGSVPNQKSIDSLLQFVSFENGVNHHMGFHLDSLIFFKMKPGFRLDFNAVAQGLSVDVLSDFIRSKGIKNFYVEIGGELVVSGKNREGKPWRIGIDSPVEDSQERILDNIIEVSDCGLATSGNYRKFYVEDGKKYAHTIDPRTGSPVNHSLLSATVICESAGLADAWATAFMVMGKEKAIELLEKDNSDKLDVYFIFDKGDDEFGYWMTPGFKKRIAKD